MIRLALPAVATSWNFSFTYLTHFLWLFVSTRSIHHLFVIISIKEFFEVNIFVRLSVYLFVCLCADILSVVLYANIHQKLQSSFLFVTDHVQFWTSFGSWGLSTNVVSLLFLLQKRKERPIETKGYFGLEDLYSACAPAVLDLWTSILLFHTVFPLPLLHFVISFCDHRCRKPAFPLIPS